MTDTELARLRGVVVTRLDEQRRDDPDRPIRIVVAGVAFAELTEAEALTIAAALGAVVPDEAAKLRATARRAAVLQRIAERNTRQAEADLAEANEREAQFDARLAGLEAAHARRWQRWGEERDTLRERVEHAEEQVADALALHAESGGLCTECVEWCDCIDKDPAAKLGDCTHGNVAWPCKTVAALTRKADDRG